MSAAAPDATQQLATLRLELAKDEAAVQPLYARRQRLEDEAVSLAQRIDAAKRRPEGVARDRELQALLAQSKSKTDELEHVQAELRWREPGLAELRRRVLRTVDIVLESKALPEAMRLDLERLRVTTVAMITSPALPVQVVKDPKSVVDPLDGPRELREKADLLRDSGDKLRREVKRIAGRLDSVERRRRLRERSGALDEDLFGESTSNRRVARVTTGASDTSSNDHSGTANGTATTLSPTAGGNTSNATTPALTNGAATGAPSSNGPTGVTQMPTQTLGNNSTTTLRNLVDPATLDELQQADAIDDADRQTKALRKAQSELETLAKELDRRAKALDSRAEQLKQQK